MWKWILNLADFISKLAQRLLWLLETRFDIVHCAGFNHQTPYTLSQLSTTGKDGTPKDNALPVMAFFAPAKEHENESAETTDIIKD